MSSLPHIHQVRPAVVGSQRAHSFLQPAPHEALPGAQLYVEQSTQTQDDGTGALWWRVHPDLAHTELYLEHTLSGSDSPCEAIHVKVLILSIYDNKIHEKEK
jgi:hypothetical protein